MRTLQGIKCVGINPKLYEMLQAEEAKQIHWFCNTCNQVAVEIIGAGMKMLHEVKLDISKVRKIVDE